MAITVVSTKATHRAGSSWVDGDPALPIISTPDGVAPINWSDNGAGGAFQAIDDTSVVYIPANRTQSVQITGVDSASGTGNTTIGVTATFPLQPTREFDTQLDRDTKMRRARGGTRYFREDYETEVALSLTMERRLRDEALTLRDFWSFHRKVVPFYYLDVTTGMLNLVRFESAINYRFLGACWWTLACGVRGDYQGVTAPETAPPVLRIAAGHYLNSVGEWRMDTQVAAGQAFNFGPVVVDSSGLTDPVPPDEVLQWCRFDPLQIFYNIDGLKALQDYAIRLIFASPTARDMNINLQGVGVDTVSVPGSMTAVERINTATSDSSGLMVIWLAHTSGPNTLVNAIELIEV